MINRFASLLTAPDIEALPPVEISWAPVIVLLISAVLLLLLALFFRPRFLKILCLCSFEICMFFVCRKIFGDESIVTEIMRWFTAAVACIATVSIVNRINWSNLRGK